MRIVIFDENREEAEFYEELCRELGETYDVPVELKLYDSSRKLLFDIEILEFRKKLDVVFFAFDEKNLEDPHRMREAGYEGLIVFIGGSEMVMPYEELFDTEAYNFVQRSRTPEHLDRFAHIFQNAVKTVAKNRMEKLALSYGGEMRQIDISEIYYFEVEKYSLIVHYGEGKSFTFVSSLTKMENQLKGRGFVRVSRFHLVSVKAVTEMKSDSVVMRDGTTIPIGRRYYGELKATIEAGKA
ncbi:MAG: LytTR family transcriptional regulator DNA-binding domain-containing protein [Oscillospiraceae bacterium]|nr:LytTR family transcriptional regulator DNA-binding domain-containing protein [Oscillospiraceae bacterium]